ncbi:MAG: preprotein translocase subunit SecF [Candidatus Aenigmatarchaeota archaeon]
MKYKKLLFVPLVLLIISVACFTFLKGEFSLDIDFKGGTQLSLESSKPVDAASIRAAISQYEPAVRVARGLSSYTVIIDVDSSVNSSAVLDDLQKAGYRFDSESSQTIGASLGKSFFSQAQLAFAFAFAFMALVVFIVFRQPLPSLYMVMCAALDITEALLVSQILGINLSLATFAALLLLIGYSVDSDILLTSRVLKTSEGEPKERVRGAFRTCMTMSMAAIGAVAVLYFATSSMVLQQISAVILIGLLFDIPNTWLFNAPLLLWWVERKRGCQE